MKLGSELGVRPSPNVARKTGAAAAGAMDGKVSRLVTRSGMDAAASASADAFDGLWKYGCEQRATYAQHARARARTRVSQQSQRIAR